MSAESCVGFGGSFLIYLVCIVGTPSWSLISDLPFIVGTPSWSQELEAAKVAAAAAADAAAKQAAELQRKLNTAQVRRAAVPGAIVSSRSAW
jgi:hypothetical protein